MKLLVTGLGGLIGSRIAELFTQKYDFEDISRRSGIDITDSKAVLEKISSSDAPLIIHLAAKAQVDSCEKDKQQGTQGEAWIINVEGTRNIVKAAEKTGKKILYISTDFVFDGKKPVGELYTELDEPSPINWYATTKYEAEKIVQAASPSHIIARLAYPYRSSFSKKDFVRSIAERLRNEEVIQGVTDHIFTPTFIDDIAYAFDVLIEKKEQGIFHIVGSQALTPFEAALKIKEKFDLAGSVEKTTRDVFFKNVAPRPFNLALTNGKITQLGIQMKTFDDGLAEVKKQFKS